MTDTINGYTRRWWKEAVVYQVYPRAFMDGNGDGIGDLAGILDKVPYIKGLGVDVVWLSPHFDSPNADNGYDIRDYRKVMAEFGDMDDFDALLKALHDAGIRLIIDLVVNHSSDEHAWFVESRSSRDNPYRDYYIWHPGHDGAPPNNWTSIFTGPAWQRDEATGDYYLHLFAAKQPDLNWDNPQVRHEVYDLMRFWLDKGVDGFRMDVIPFISKRPGLPDLAEAERAKPQFAYADGPRVHEYLQEMRREALAPYDTLTVGEAFGVTLDQTPLFVDDRRGELDMIFQFDAVEIDRDANGKWQPWRLQDFKAIFSRHDAALDTHCWSTVFFSNHDNPRIVSRYGDDRPQWRERSAKLMATLLLTMKGTPFIYQGDEVGMTNYPFTDISQFDDLWVKGAWREEVESGRVAAADFLANQMKISRDHARTPMQWTSGKNGGFTRGQPWLAVNPNTAEINAEKAVADPSSVYHYYAAMIALRRRHPALVYGAYRDRLPDHPQVFAYTREIDDEKWLVMLNFSVDEVAVDLPSGTRIAGNYSDEAPVLRGWEARVCKF
jgi:oligo-1,6-glucosidase